MTELYLVEKAKAFAAISHDGQMYGAEPYMVHLDAVAQIVSGDNTAVVIAYLHDVVEDTPVTLLDIATCFGGFIAECVGILTDEPGGNRKERKAKSHAKLSKVMPEHYTALKVKTADRLANLRACVSAQGNMRLFEMYRKEHIAFWGAVYRPELCEELWREMDAIMLLGSKKTKEKEWNGRSGMNSIIAT